MGQLDYTTAQANDKLTGVYGSIHTHDNSTTQSIPTGATYTKLVEWMDNGEALNTVPDQANAEITVNKDGMYRIEGAFSFSSGTGNITAFGALFINDIEVEEIHWTRKISTAGDVGNANFTGLVRLSASDVIDTRVRHSGAGSVDFTFSYMNLNLNREDI